MKKKGITFNEVSESDAKDFLQKNNYYMKLAAYRSNYEKCPTGKRAGQYKKLDFGYLKELSTIDMYLRYIIIDMCSVWVFVELISFGDLLYFCSFYEEVYAVQIVNNTLMNTVRDVRNVAAHSNCLLNKMTERIDPTKQVNSDISNFVKGMSDISKTSRVNNLNYKFANSFVTLLYVYDGLMAEGSKQKRYKELQEFMNGRVIKNKSYFKSNSKIVGVYNFHKKVIDNLAK